MSISSEITSMGVNLQADYEGLENIGADLTGINKNILNIRTILDTIYNDLPKVTGEGTEVTLSPTRKGRLVTTPKGNSTQESTNGYNLADYNGTQVSLAKSGTRYTFVIPTNFPLTLEAGTYTLSFEDFTPSNMGKALGIQMLKVNGEEYISLSFDNTTKKATFTTNQSVQFRAIYVFIQSTDNDNATCTFSKIMLESGSTAHTWEQYTGGIPAPNPSFPFNVNSVTGNNNVVVHNKNMLLKGTKFTPTSNNWYDNFGVVSNSISALESNSHYYDLKANTQYTIKVNEYANVANWQLVYISNGNIGAITYKGVNVTDAKTFTPSTDTRVWFRINTENPNVETYCYAQLELGSTATSYQERQEVTKPLNLGTIELNKIGNYQDYIYKNNGKWYKHEEIGKVVLNGTENWLKSGNNFYINGTNYLTYNNGGLCYVSHFIGSAINYSTDDLHSFIGNSSFLIIRYDTISSVENFKTWLSNNNVTAYYILATSTDIEITDTSLIEQLEDIDKMQGYNGTTIITSTYDSNNAQMYISASGLKGE